MPSSIIIRNETATDAQAINDVTIAAFANAEHSSHTEQYIVSALRAAGALSISKVAECDGQIVGHVAVSPISISDGSADWYGLGPIAVAPQMQHQGIGSKLMATALDALRQRNAAGCVLLGDPNYYQRFGFQPISRLVLADVPPAYFQALAFGDSVPQGNVTYHAAFNATS